MKFLGKDKHGFRYFQSGDYVYQQYPVDKEWWVRGTNMQGQENGCYCSIPAWERTMHNCLVKEG